MPLKIRGGGRDFPQNRAPICKGKQSDDAKSEIHRDFDDVIAAEFEWLEGYPIDIL